MIYFDTDVLVNYLIRQDAAKNQQAVQLYQSASDEGIFFCSLLCLQETAFVLNRLKVDNQNIDTMISSLFTSSMVSYNANQFSRAKELAKKVGFQNINDCLHTAIAETYCQELYTFNKSDFKRIQRHTKLKITIL
jgi:predicted nucleic acid-binding protein